MRWKKGTKKERLRDEIVALEEEYRILLALAAQLGPESVRAYDVQMSRVTQASKAELESLRVDVRKRVTDLKTECGAQLSRETLQWLRDQMHRAEETGELWYAPVQALRRLAPGVFGEGRRSTHTPWGGLQTVDFWGVLPVGHYESFFLEASLYEDMALHFNRASRLSVETVQWVTTRQTLEGRTVLKELKASLRAAALDAVFTIEAYLNSIAFDHVCTNQDVQQKDLGLLLERDMENDRPQHLQLREKIPKYPRIITGADHPPIQESNCAEVRRVVEAGKDLRDAIAHPSPWPEIRDPSKEGKLFRYFHVDLESVEQIVDDVVELIGRLEVEINGSRDRLGWLMKRGKDGLFPDEVFR